jgi:hypothetical protein
MGELCGDQARGRGAAEGDSQVVAADEITEVI